MYKIIKRNSGSHNKGEVIRDREFYVDMHRILSEEGTPPVVRHYPDYRWEVRDEMAGTIVKSHKQRSVASAFKNATDYLAKDEIRQGVFDREGYTITIYTDGEPYLTTSIKYKWGW